MHPALSFLCLFLVMPAAAQQAVNINNDNTNNGKQPSVELLEFLAEFNMQTDNDDKDYDLIQYHALQDLKKQQQERNNDR